MNKIKSFLTTYGLYIAAAVAFVAVFVLARTYLQSHQLENLTNQLGALENVTLHESCKDMTPIQLFALFQQDLNRMTQVMLDNNIPQEALQQPALYPKIASLLKAKGVINC